jgi:hypothetical protein
MPIVSLSYTNLKKKVFRVELPPDDRPSMLCSGLQTYPEYASNLEGTINLFVSSGSSDPFLYSRVDPYIEAIACIQNETLTTAFLMTIYGWGLLLRGDKNKKLARRIFQLNFFYSAASTNHLPENYFDVSLFWTFPASSSTIG